MEVGPSRGANRLRPIAPADLRITMLLAESAVHDAGSSGSRFRSEGWRCVLACVPRCVPTAYRHSARRHDYLFGRVATRIRVPPVGSSGSCRQVVCSPHRPPLFHARSNSSLSCFSLRRADRKRNIPHAATPLATPIRTLSSTSQLSESPQSVS